MILFDLIPCRRIIDQSRNAIFPSSHEFPTPTGVILSEYDRDLWYEKLSLGDNTFIHFDSDRRPTCDEQGTYG